MAIEPRRLCSGHDQSRDAGGRLSPARDGPGPGPAPAHDQPARLRGPRRDVRLRFHLRGQPRRGRRRGPGRGHAPGGPARDAPDAGDQLRAVADAGAGRGCRLQCRLAIETRTNAYQVRTGEFPDDQISVYFTVRQYWGTGPGPDRSSSRSAGSERSARRSCEQVGHPADRPPAGAGDRARGQAWRSASHERTDAACSVEPNPILERRPMPRLSTAGPRPDRRDRVHRAGRCAEPESAGQGRRRAGDRRQPLPQHAAAKAAGIQAIEENQTRYCPSLGCPSSARRPRGSSRPSSASRLPPRTSSWPPGRRRSSSSSARRSSTRATACSSSARTSRPTFPTSSAGGRGPCWRRLRPEHDFRPQRRRRRALPGHRPAAPGDLPQLAAQPDRRRRHPATTWPRSPIVVRGTNYGLQRRAVLPHGLGGRHARSSPSPACSTRPSRPTPSANRTA